MANKSKSMSAPAKQSAFKRFTDAISYDFKHNKILWALSLPGLILLIVFKYFPMYGILIAFQDYNLFGGMANSEWIGFANFVRFFNDPYFFRLLKNTFIIGIYGVLFTFPAPIFLALILNEMRFEGFKKVTQTISYFPHFISTVIIVGILKTMLSVDGGVINMIIEAFGGTAIQFLNEPKWFRTVYILSDIWQSVGYGSIVYLAAITGVDVQLYEAAKIDGASRFRCMISITLPCILPTIMVMLIMKIGSILSVGFEKIFLLYSPSTYETADVISTYVYRKGMVEQDFGFSTAVGLFNSLINIIFLFGSNWFSKKFLDEGLW